MVFDAGRSCDLFLIKLTDISFLRICQGLTQILLMPIVYVVFLLTQNDERLRTDREKGELRASSINSKLESYSLKSHMQLMTQSHCMGPGTGQGPENGGFLYYTMYCTHYT